MFANIKTRNELADFLKIPRQKLTHVLYIKKVESFYVSFDVPKKTGGQRRINAPMDDLKEIQKLLADALWKHELSVREQRNFKSTISNAFEKSKSIITNAKIHKNKNILVNLDLADFFDSFHFGRVRGFFEKNRDFLLPIEVATVIAQLTCFKGSLPQGAPTSPIITNMIFRIVDFRLLAIARKYKLDYTRYADDLTFSTNNWAFLAVQSDFLDELETEIVAGGFRINKKKTRIQLRDSKQVVTGLVVNKKLNVDHAYYKKTRAMAHSLYFSKTFNIDEFEGTLSQLEGRFSFINQLDWYNNNQSKIDKAGFRNLNGREKQYQKFLFYRYFFNNDLPLIVTEGKTDIVYIRCALKSLYAEYPKLITKKANGRFEYKISFFNRSKRFRYFFGIALDGANTMAKIYNFFKPPANEKCFTNYLNYFNKICPSSPRKPIVFIFDNETINKDKPLTQFIKHIKLSEDNKTELLKSLYIKLLNTGNLFLVTNPLINKEECEIEDLFDRETLEHTIDGKKFSRKSEDESECYGKHVFSQYIAENYTIINFSGFRQFLNAINDVVSQYTAP